MNSITAILMTYGADLGSLLAGPAASVTLYLSLRRTHGKHRTGRRR